MNYESSLNGTTKYYKKWGMSQLKKNSQWSVF